MSQGPRCLALDLEVGKRDARIHRFAAVRADTGQTLVYTGGDLNAALADLDAMAATAAFVLGHNLIAFDLPHLAAVQPGLQLLGMPAVDTLRLNPLAFPRNPYHHLVKHYQDGALQGGQASDPLADTHLALALFDDQLKALRAAPPDLLAAWHWLTTEPGERGGLNAFWMTVRRQPRPSDEDARTAIAVRLEGQGCADSAAKIASEAATHGWALAYALAWLSVAGGNSVMPPWVRHQFPAAGTLVRQLRDTPCTLPCPWCREQHDPREALRRWFGFDDFRPEPADAMGRPLQQSIVQAAMLGRHVLGILPTGTGKSLCYQIPALSRYHKTGALTVVISPLVALMADQVSGLEARGITSCAALNGLLSMPERADVLDRVRLGEVAILIVSPEQLRSPALRKVLAQREIGAWVLDEAHCISKWGHDFRPDYRYVGRFIKESAGDAPVPPVLCLTATAKPDVVSDMLAYFRRRVGIGMEVFNGGARRENLAFDVIATTPAEKFSRVAQLLDEGLTSGGAIVYCASRKQTEELASYLSIKGMAADFFHAGLPPDSKKRTQQRFIDGELRVITATNAFGMGIDKPDVRLVIHADMPGSLENYLQEAGRAGRDRAAARCVLLYTPADVERQFSMSARSRLTQREIQAILRALRRIDRMKRLDGEIVATAGEILAEDDDSAFERDSATDDTRVRTAISWLEEAQLLKREENRVQVFPSSLKVASLDQARARLATLPLADQYRRQLLALVQTLIGADRDEGVSTDALMGASGLSSEQVRAALYDLERAGVASNDTALTAFVHAGVERSSKKRLDEAGALEAALIASLREAAPNLGKGTPTLLHLRRATQALKDAGHAGALPEKLARIVQGLAKDGRGEDGGIGSVAVRRVDAESLQVTLQREWSALEQTAHLRRAAAARLLEHLLAALPAGTRGTDLLVETTLGKLHAALANDLALRSAVRDTGKLLDRALLWLHEMEVIRLNKGLAVFRPAMTIRLAPEKRAFQKADFAPLKLHYDEQVVQIHVMAEYVQRGMEAIGSALQLAMDYFHLEREDFLQRWLPGRELAHQTTPASWRSIVEDLNNPVQQRIVADEREQSNVLVLAGPGSGKTRVLVHRIAYLLRVRRENPRAILALAYNRHAALEIRRRLHALVGDDARGVVVMTCHAFAMRLVGASFSGRSMADEAAFRDIMREAVALLGGADAEEADAERERLLAGFRWILVDEYQDIGPEQYDLISALAGRTRSEEQGRMTMFAVGDDDQNIYAYDGASVDFIRRFEQDYSARPVYLIENYRSTAHIIEAANGVIAGARARMKAGHPVKPDRGRLRAPAGGAWSELDPFARGRVQVLAAGVGDIEQAIAVMAELRRLAALDPAWDWARVAVIARAWQTLSPLRSYCELHGIAVQMADDEPLPFWRLREVQALIDWLGGRSAPLVDGPAIAAWLGAQPQGPCWELLRAACAEYRLESADVEAPPSHVLDWLAEWGRSVRRKQTGLLLLSAHRAKGLEFDHVAILDGGWEHASRSEDADAPRRLLYVAMTRARHTLTLACQHGKGLVAALADGPHLLRRPAPAFEVPSTQLRRQYRQLGMKEIDLGFPARGAASASVRAAIAGLAPGDALVLAQREEHWELLDPAGQVVGRLARAYQTPRGMRCLQARVAAIVVRRREDAEAGFREMMRCERWEVVLPELVFEPARSSQ